MKQIESPKSEFNVKQPNNASKELVGVKNLNVTPYNLKKKSVNSSRQKAVKNTGIISPKGVVTQ